MEGFGCFVMKKMSSIIGRKLYEVINIEVNNEVI